MNGINERTREQARAVLADCMEEAVYFESGKRDLRGRALLALGLVTLGIGLGLARNADALPIPAKPTVGVEKVLDTSVPGTDTWTADGISDFVKALNQQIEADARFSGKVVVVDTGLASESEMVDQGMGAFHANEDARARVDAGVLDEAEVSGLIQLLTTGSAISNGKEVADDGYFCFAAGVTADEMTKDFAGIMSRAGDKVDIVSHVSSETAHKITIAHEVGHCLGGIVKISDDALYNRVWNEHTADTFAALYHLKTGGSTADVAKLADLRDMRLGYAPNGVEESLVAYEVSHDTGAALRAIVAAAPGLYKDGGLKDMSLAQIVDLAQKFSKDAMPSYEQFKENVAAFHLVKDATTISRELGIDPASLVDPATLTPDGLASLQRFDAAFKALTGQDTSPVNGLLPQAPAVAAIPPGAPPPDPALLAPREVEIAGLEGKPWQATRPAAEQRLADALEGLVPGDKELVADGLTAFARRAAALELDPQAAAEIALENRAVAGVLPGFSVFGLDSPARRAAKAAFRDGFALALAEYARTAEPLRVPAHPDGTHVVKAQPNMVSVHLKGEDGAPGALDNPVDAAAVIRGHGERHFHNGERVPAPYGLTGELARDRAAS